MLLRICLIAAALGAAAPAQESGTSTTASGRDAAHGRLVFSEDFSAGATRWRSPDPSAFLIETDGNDHVLHQFRQSRVRTPVRSPFNRAVCREQVGSFTLDVDLKSTARDYPHRSLCLFFGYQDPAHFYYVHFGQRTDDHANQIFIVNEAPRTKISTATTSGTPWDDQWHHARIVRDVESGSIEVYFDDMTKPVMTATDRTFTRGAIGIGSFDDTGMFRRVELRVPGNGTVSN